MDFPSPLANLPKKVNNPGPFPRSASIPSLRHLDREAAPLVLGQNVPNPHPGETTIPFTLLNPADVRLEIFDLLGRKMAAVVRRGLGSGEHHIQLNLRGLRLPLGNYTYQLQAASALGTHSLSRVMALTVEDTE
ncbi:MAG: T9SS type A sorting domain-containing protein [Bacteroidota bacterium]|nr:T9SS type A sorting domain-containing protein [Bacteroidota bacterium]